MLQKGRELDAEVAKHVFKLKVTHQPKDLTSNGPLAHVDFWNVEPSDMTDWEEDFNNRGSLRRYSTSAKEGNNLLTYLGEQGHQIRISNKASGNKYWWVYLDEACAQGDTMFEALCIAAVKLYSEKKK
jgi:hypothetical protein